ncbi:MAG TPA: hypothetical protein PK264_06235 [Hyphomicrobiaceae bacterium]|nr:hypothetical protein [Hyphomicrobiaceae bacterium]
MAAQQEKPKISDKTVMALMNYAWQILPTQFTSTTGKKIEIDKKKREENVVPLDVAREVILVGYNSAHAQLCELWEEQNANYHTMMRLEVAKKKWTEQQLLYISTLHRMTIHFAAGKVRIVEKGPDEQQVILEPIEKAACDEAKRQKIKSEILTYIAKHGGIATPPAPGTTPPPATAATPPPAASGPVPVSQPQPPKK